MGLPSQGGATAAVATQQAAGPNLGGVPCGAPGNARGPVGAGPPAVQGGMPPVWDGGRASQQALGARWDGGGRHAAAGSAPGAAPAAATTIAVEATQQAGGCRPDRGPRDAVGTGAIWTAEAAVTATQHARNLYRDGGPHAAASKRAKGLDAMALAATQQAGDARWDGGPHVADPPAGPEEDPDQAAATAPGRVCVPTEAATGRRLVDAELSGRGTPAAAVPAGRRLFPGDRTAVLHVVLEVTHEPQTKTLRLLNEFTVGTFSSLHPCATIG